MAKTKDELSTLKTEYEALNAKLKELSDEELGYVVGGSYQGITSFYLNDEGHWFRLYHDRTYIYRVHKTYQIVPLGDGKVASPAALLDRFWYKGSEAWYYGTVSEIDCGSEDYYQAISAPTIIHDDKMYTTKPF